MSKQNQTAQQYWDERSELFGNYYEKPSLFDKVFRKAVYTRVAVSLKTIKSYPNATVLDIGSGPGMNSVAFLKNTTASKLLGIDFAPNMIEYSRNIVKKEGVADKATFVEGDFITYDFKDEKYDVSVAMGVLDYIEDAQNFVSKMYRVNPIRSH